MVRVRVPDHRDMVIQKPPHQRAQLIGLSHRTGCKARVVVVVVVAVVVVLCVMWREEMKGNMLLLSAHATCLHVTYKQYFLIELAHLGEPKKTKLNLWRRHFLAEKVSCAGWDSLRFAAERWWETVAIQWQTHEQLLPYGNTLPQNRNQQHHRPSPCFTVEDFVICQFGRHWLSNPHRFISPRLYL